MRNKIFALLLGLALFSSSAYAAVGVTNNNAKRKQTPAASTTVQSQATNINFMGFPQQYFDGSVYTVDGTSAGATGGTIDGAYIGGSSPSTIRFKREVYVVSATSSTLSTVADYNGNNSTVTLGRSGAVFVVKPAQGVVPIVLSLPGTYTTTYGSFTGETYTITTGTGNTVKLRTASATDASIAFGPAGSQTAITSPASSGSTVTVVGYGNVWYIGSMNTGNTNGGATPSWTPGSF